MPWCELESAKVHYELYGQGETTIVFIAGYTCDIELFRQQADALSATHQVLLFDNRGIGATVDNGEELTADNMTKTIADLMAALSIRSAIIVGYAFGSCLALTLSRDYPECVSQLVLVAGLKRFSHECKDVVKQLFMLGEQGTQYELCRLLYDTCYGSKFRHRVSFDEFFEKTLQVQSVQTIEDQRRQLHALLTFDASQWVSSIGVPCTVLGLQEDTLVTLNDTRALASAMAASFIEVPLGHAALLEDAHQMTDVIKNVLIR